MEIFKECNEEYVIKLNNREEAELLHSILEFISREKTRQLLDTRMSIEEYKLASDIAKELELYLNFTCCYK